MITQLSGLSFHCHSPSQFELIHNEPCADRVFVWYTGSLNRDAGAGKWAIAYVHPNGHQVRRCFNSRDAAVAFIVDAPLRAMA